MCGIVGFLARDTRLRESLGEFVVPMLTCMGERGPDSAGLAIFSDDLPDGLRRYSFYTSVRTFDWLRFLEDFAAATEATAEIDVVESHAVLMTSATPAMVNEWLAARRDPIHLLSVGRKIDVYKDEGHPADISRRYGFTAFTGSHAVGHTRMATESAVSPAHAHPFTAGEDFCLVHNGSLSNPYSIRRRLEKKGVRFETDNDTEAACRFLEWRMREGDPLERALERGFDELDGFYTLLMATADKLVLVRDAFACKPAVVAETDEYVAISSEYRALAHLPGVKGARIFEPVPEQIYSWTA
ncbi:MAG: class II glutamine amidotransferase [Planctomycetes bacterium]|nr:class II glutamine amidotransferase [Planctomycetota bacterium]